MADALFNAIYCEPRAIQAVSCRKHNGIGTLGPANGPVFPDGRELTRWCNGNTCDFGSHIQGSNPCRVAGKKQAAGGRAETCLVYQLTLGRPQNYGGMATGRRRWCWAMLFEARECLAGWLCFFEIEYGLA